MKLSNDHYDLVIGSWLLCPIEYGDYSGMTDEEVVKLENYLTALSPSGGVWTFEDEEYHGRCCVTGMMSTVVAAKFTPYIKDNQK